MRNPALQPTTALAPLKLAMADAATVAAAYLTLLKPKITLLLAAFGVVAAYLAAGGSLPAGQVLIFTLLGIMASGGAACLNHYFDRDIDARMARTRKRPIPSGKVAPASALLLATVLLAVSVPLAYLTLNLTVALLLALGAAVYSGLYTLVLKRRTEHNIVIGGFAGSCGALAGWAVADPSLPIGAWLLATIVFLWTPPHFWGLAIARDADYRAAKVPMLPQVAGVARTASAMLRYGVAVWLVSLAVVPFTDLGLLYGIGALLLGGLFTALCVAFWKNPTPALGIKVFKSSGAYLGLLLIVMLADMMV